MLFRDEVKPALILLAALVAGLTVKEIKLHRNGAYYSAANVGVGTKERAMIE
jgi:hypothetical protein